MKKSGISRIVICGIIVLGILNGICVCSGAGTESLISTGSSCPAIRPASDSGWIVWEKNCPASQSIIAYNLSTGMELTLPAASSHPHYPYIQGNHVVWYEGASGSPTELYYADLDATPITAIRVPADPSEKINPAVYGNKIVWQNKPAGSATYDILMYDRGTNAVYNLTPGTASSNQQEPSIFGDRVVWEDNRNGGWDIYMNDTSDGSLTAIPAAPDGSAPLKPMINGNSIVWYSDSYDIFQADLVTTPPTINQITNDADNQITPAVSGTSIIWRDDQFGASYDIMYLDTLHPPPERITDNSAVLLGDASWVPRLTTDDRIIWQDERNGNTHIYMFTRNVIQPCEANFTSPATGAKNVAVSFINTSTGWQTNWRWDFGDGGTATTANASHTYTSSGTFPVKLTVNNPYCRNMTPLIASRYISIDDAPVANFDANITVGMVPLTVQFTNKSTGWQQSYAWDFGDGNTSTSANPLFTYNVSGIYNVSLTTTNGYGSDNELKTGTGFITGYIHALGGASDIQNTTIAGISFVTTGGHQQLSFNKTLLPDFTFNLINNSFLSCVPPASSGFQQISFFSLDGIGFSLAAGNITGNVSRTNLMSRVIQSTGFPAAIGNPVKVNYTIDYPGYPVGATITTNIYNDTAVDYPIFLNLAMGAMFSSIHGIPYIVQFQKTNLGSGYLATINMSVNSAWVANHGGTDHMYTMRLGDDSYGEVLPVSRVSQDGVNNLDNYEIASPRGLSKFALSGLSGSGNIFQMVYLGVAQHFISSSSSESYTGVLGKSTGTGQGLSSQHSLSLAYAPEPPAAPEAKSVDLFINDQAVITQTTILQSPDQLATLSIGQGVVAKDSAENPLSSVTIASASMSASGIPESLQGSTFSFAGIAYNLQPDGATFSPAATITFTVPQAQWSQHYMVKEWDPLAQVWVDLPTTYHPESGTISASVSNFCIIALFSDTITPSPTRPRITVQTPLPTIAPPSPTSPFGIFYGMVAWLADMFMKNMYLFLIVSAIAVAFYVNRRRKGRDPLRFK